jgi:hypothetical protein
MENEIINLNLLCLNLNNIFQILFSIYIPTINAALTESMAKTSDETKLNMLIATMGTLVQSF